MAIINIGWSPTGRASRHAEEQILEPVSHPDEMALPWSEAVERLQNSEDYTARFAVAFGDDVITPERTTQAIAQFLRTMVSANSKFDQWRRGETFLTDAEFAGYEIFLREGGDRKPHQAANLGAIVFTATGRRACNSAIICFATTDWTARLQPIPVMLWSRVIRSIRANSKHPRFATLRSQVPTCTTVVSRRWRR